MKRKDDKLYVNDNSFNSWIDINDLNGEKIIETFHEKELQKTNQQEFRIEKLIKIKVDRLYVNDSLFNS